VHPVEVSRETMAVIQRVVGIVAQPWRLLAPVLTHSPTVGPKVEALPTLRVSGARSRTPDLSSWTMAESSVLESQAVSPTGQPMIHMEADEVDAPCRDEDVLSPLDDEDPDEADVIEPTPATSPDPGTVKKPSKPPRILAVANQKGGVGKTTTAVNLGACLAELGLRTLIVDLDPQGNASTGLGLNIRELDVTMYDVMLQQATIEDCIEPAALKNLFVAPASLDLAGAEIELVSAMSRELRLKTALADVGADYDYILIDCPPSLGLLTLNGLAAAQEVVVPIQCEYYALEGLGQLLRNVDLVKRNLNPTLEVSMIVLVMYDGRTTLAREVAKEVRQHFGDRVCESVIPRTVRLSEAPSYGQPINTFDPRSRGAEAYRNLAREVANGAA
jgi:chromosome partitioning protein